MERLQAFIVCSSAFTPKMERVRRQSQVMVADCQMTLQPS